MEYFELPDGSTSFLHLIKNRNTLWDINNEPQMYEVEFLNDNKENLDMNLDDIINMNKVYCNICSIDVPKLYLKQHNKTSIHQNLTKLMDEVLERTKKHLKTNDELTNASVNATDTFFCEICSKIVQNNNRNEHFESKLHKKLVVFEKILNIFINAYLRVDEEIEFDLEDLKDCMKSKESIPLKNTSDLPANTSKDPSQILKPLDPSKVPSDITKEPAINIFGTDYLKELLESGRNESLYSSESENDETVEQINMRSLQISTDSSKIDPTMALDLVPKNTKSEHSVIQPNLNPMNPNYHYMNSNLNPTDSMWTPINPPNPMNSNWNPVNPNLNYMHSNWNPMASNLNAYLNHMNPNLNPMNPNFNPMNPNLNPMNPNFNPKNPNFNPMNPNLHNLNQINPNLHQVSPHLNPINPNINPVNPNLHPMNPNLIPNPNLNPINPYFHLMNPDINTMDHRYKINPNLNPMTPNLNMTNPNLNIMNSNLNTLNPSSQLDPRHKTGPNLKPMEPQPQLGSTLKTIDTQLKLAPNRNTTDPAPVAAEAKKLLKAMKKAEREREKQKMKNDLADIQFKEFSSYIKTIQDKYPKPGFKLEAVTVSKIKITALNGDCVLVTRDNFQSINKKYCRVCQNGNLGKDHGMSEEHISRIMVPVADKNCIREIDDIWSHCIICNELIKFVEDHKKTAAHLTNLKGCFIDISKQTEENEPKNIILEKELNNEKQSDEEKNTNIVHIEKRENVQENKSVFKFDIDKFSNSLADKLLPFFAKYAIPKEDDGDSNENMNDGTLESEKIDTVVSKEKNDKKDIKPLKESAHIVLDKDYKSVEIKKLDDEVVSNSSPSKNTTKYCSICRIHVNDFESHKTSDSHIEINNRTKEVRKIINRNNLKEIKDSNDLLKCDLCVINVKYNSIDIDAHVNCQNHRRNYFKFIEFNKIILIDQVESQCEPCNKSIHRSNIFDHCKQDKHVKKLKDLIDMANKQTKKESKESNTTPVQNDIDVTKILYHFRAQDVEYLKTCHALVARDAASVKNHIEAKQHVEKYNKLLLSNKIYKKTGSFYCEVCDAQIPMTGEIAHVYGRNHIDNLAVKAEVAKEESNGATTSPSAALVASTSKEGSVTSGKGETKIPLYIKYQYMNISESFPTCIICQQKIPYADITNHAHYTTHNFNFNLIMINNTIKIKGNMYFCVNCNTSVPVFGEIQHIFGKLHLNNKKKKQQPIASKGTGMLTYDHVLNLTQGKRMVKF